MLNSHANSETKISSESLLNRIEQHENNELFSIFNAQLDDRINAMIIKVNLNRAVFEHASFFKKFIHLLLMHDIKHYILDFSDTVFLDSTFLGSIIYFFKNVNAKRRKLSLVIDSSKITILSEVFDLGGVNIFTTLKEAKTEIRIEMK